MHKYCRGQQGLGQQGYRTRTEENVKEAGLGQVGDRIMNIRGQDQNKKEAGPGQEGD